MHIESNWKGGCNVTFDPHTLIIGPVGSRKSAIIEPLMLALTGAVDGIQGRDAVKDGQLLARARPAGDGTLYVNLQLDDGRTIRWEMEGTSRPTWTIDGSKVKADDKKALAGLLSMRQVREKLFASPEKAEKWLYDVLGFDEDEVFKLARKKITKADVRDAARELLDEQAKIHKKDPDAVVESLAKLKRGKKAEAKHNVETAEQIEQSAGGVVTDEEIAEARQTEEKARNNKQQWEAIARTAHQLQQISEQMRPLQHDIADARASIPPNAQRLPDADHALAEALLRAGRLWAQAYPNSDVCPFSGVNVGFETIRNHLSRLNVAVSAHDALVRVEAKQAELDNLWAQGRQLTQQLPESTREMSIEQIEAHLRDAQDMQRRANEVLADLQQRQMKTNHSASTARALAEAAEERVKVIDAALRALRNALKASVDGELEALEKEASAYVPSRLGELKIQLRPRVAIGFDRDGVLGLPSGGEEGCALLGLCAALADRYRLNNPPDNGEAVLPPLIIGEDRGLDPQTLSDQLEALAAVQHALVVIPSVLDPATEESMRSWAVIRPQESPTLGDGDGEGASREEQPQEQPQEPPHLELIREINGVGERIEAAASAAEDDPFTDDR